MNEKAKNYIRAVRFERPDYIPMKFAINDACWHHYTKDFLWEMMESHPLLFPDFQRPAADWEPAIAPVARKNAPYTDSFGCVWYTSDDGITGTVREHPLADWSAFGTAWCFPDAETTDGLYPVNWARREAEWAKVKERGDLLHLSLRHGHTFLQLCDIRGYENLLFDMYDEEPQLWELIEGLEVFNLAIVRRFLHAGCDSIGYPEDLGMQSGPMIPPDLFQKYIAPSYTRLMRPAREAGIPIHMHSDGDIRALADGLAGSGVEVINLQDLVNGIDWIADRFRGKLCIDLDIDRQKITPFGTPAQIDALIRQEVEKLGSPQGGLMMIYGLYPGVPEENVRALMDSMEKYMGYFD